METFLRLPLLLAAVTVLACQGQEGPVHVERSACWEDDRPVPAGAPPGSPCVAAEDCAAHCCGMICVGGGGWFSQACLGFFCASAEYACAEILEPECDE